MCSILRLFLSITINQHCFSLRREAHRAVGHICVCILEILRLKSCRKDSLISPARIWGFFFFSPRLHRTLTYLSVFFMNAVKSVRFESPKFDFNSHFCRSHINFIGSSHCGAPLRTNIPRGPFFSGWFQLREVIVIRCSVNNSLRFIFLFFFLTA